MVHVKFLYNLFLVVLFTVNVTVYGITYHQKRNPLYLWTCILFITYILDNTILYMTEFIESFSRFYNVLSIESPTIRTTITVVMFISYRMIGRYALGLRIKRWEYLLAAFLLLLLITLPILPFSKLTYLGYFTVNQIAFAVLCILYYQTAKQQLPPPASRKISKLIAILFIVNLAVVAEDFIVIMYLDVISPMETRIQQRNMCEDIESILTGITAFLLYIKCVMAPSAKEPISEADLPEAPPGSEHDIMEFAPSKHPYTADEQLDVFCKMHRMSVREREVLSLLLEGKRNQQIAHELYITLGTVKNHTHNIYQKCSAVNRAEVVRMIRDISEE